MTHITLTINPHDPIANFCINQQHLFAQVCLHLTIHDDSLELQDTSDQLAPLTLSFVNAPVPSQNTKQPLHKAMGTKSQNPKASAIADLTAGFGQDSLTLSRLSCPLISIESNPITAAILKTLVHQYQQHHPSTNWQVIHSCSTTWLNTIHPHITHYYLDPFFHKKKAALPKNPMQWLHRLAPLTPASDENLILKRALKQPCQRIVAKRDQHAPFIGHHKPNQGYIEQKTSRFDIYKPYID